MILLLFFSFVAGVVTILSPCILPVLPIILSSTIGGQETGKSRPLGVIAGFVASFTFFTLFLSLLVRTIGISANVLRFFSVIVVASFGVALLVPSFQNFLEQLFSKLSRFVPRGSTQTNFWSGLVVGISLGLLWTPCVGPILASVIALAITGTVTWSTFGITFAYSLGTAIPMFAIMLGGQHALQRVPWLRAHTATIQKVFGVIMIVTALGIFANVDRQLQAWLITTFPSYGIGLTQFEDRTPVRKQLAELAPATVKKEDMGKPMFVTQPKGPPAPEIIPGGVWFNSPPLTLAELRGKVVLIDFWTYSCINCQRTLPYVRRWYETYKDKGFVVIGVHSPEFEFEKSAKNVAKAIADFGLTYPVVQDNDFATWRAYENRYWPAKYLIDKDGAIRYTHFGEGAYDESERMIQELLQETGVRDITTEINNPEYQIHAQTPETYLGYARIDRFASLEEVKPDAFTVYTMPVRLSRNQFALDGEWNITSEYAVPKKGAKLSFDFDAKQVFLVMRPENTSVSVRVVLDGKENGMVTVDADTLYTLVDLPIADRHVLTLEFLDEGVELYAFTFG